MNAGTDRSTTPMVEIGEALDASKTLATMLQSKLEASRIEERILALEAAVMKNLEGPLRKTATQVMQGMGGRPIYASIIAPPATKAALRIRVKGAENMEPLELLEKVQLHIKGAYAARKLRSNDMEVFVQSVS